MTTQVRLLIAGVTLAGLLGLVYVSGPVHAAQDGDVPATIKKIGAMIQKGDDAGAKKAAAAAGKKIEELGDLMHMFRPRNKGGLGVGEKAGANPAKDGIEVMLRDLARDVPGGVAKQADALEITGYWIAALGEVSHAKAPTKDAGKKTKKAWQGWSDDMRAAGIAFAKAAKGKGAQEIKTAAAKVNASCNNCHSVFKE